MRKRRALGRQRYREAKLLDNPLWTKEKFKQRKEENE